MISLFMWMGIFFFNPQKHVSQPVLKTQVSYSIMKAFETVSSHPPRKNSVAVVPQKKEFSSSNSSVCTPMILGRIVLLMASQPSSEL